MARVTVEDCLRKVEGRFDLAILAARRAKMIQRGSKPLIETGNKSIVTALREIAAGKVWFEPKKSIEEEAIDASFEDETVAEKDQETSENPQPSIKEGTESEETAPPEEPSSSP